MNRLWDTCSFEGEGLTCSGIGRVDIGDEFKVSANGGEWAVVCTQWVGSMNERFLPAGSVRWTAIDKARWLALSRVPAEDLRTAGGG